MALAAIESVATFSVVLTEAFAAVGMSTIVPNTFLAMLRAAANGQQPTDEERKGLLKGPTERFFGHVLKTADSMESVDLLIPKKAKIHAEFEFQASEEYKVDAAIGVMVEVVTVKAGMTALYKSSSTNKITLDVDFELGHYALKEPEQETTGDEPSKRLPRTKPK